MLFAYLTLLFETNIGHPLKKEKLIIVDFNIINIYIGSVFKLT